jgi:glycosyltransferase involved in cell wall biosynthesis
MTDAPLAYLYSRYPVVSQTFCDSEMLAMEAMGRDLVIGSLYPPKDSFRHERLARLRAPVHYPPPPAVLKGLRAEAEKDGSWPAEMIARHDREYGASFQAATRARNALWFARLFQRLGVRHLHVHFANRATHTALFIKEIAGIPFSFTPHAQDFLVDLGSDALLAEMCEAATAIVAVSDFSLGLLKRKCPSAADRMIRVYNGIDLGGFPSARGSNGGFHIVSIGRLIEFKGFHHLIKAVALLRRQGRPATAEIIGEGPWREELSSLISSHGLEGFVRLAGARSQEQIKHSLAGADVFCLACTTDAKGATDILPTVITEAMASGLPVVSTRLAGVPEMVAHGETGWLVEPGDIDGLAAALGAIHADPHGARSFGLAGRARAERLFSLEVTAPALSGIWSAGGCPVPGSGARNTRRHTLWLAPEWPPGEAFAREAAWVGAHAPAHRMLAFSSTGQSPLPSPAADYLPDGIVLEAAWRAHPEWVAVCEAIRHELGGWVDGEGFFQAARRAVWLAEEAPKRGVAHLHAARARTLPVAWLAAHFAGLPFSGLLEPGHDLDAKFVARMAETARFLAGTKENPDPLGLAPQTPKKRGIFTRAAADQPDTGSILDGWFQER